MTSASTIARTATGTAISPTPAMVTALPGAERRFEASALPSDIVAAFFPPPCALCARLESPDFRHQRAALQSQKLCRAGLIAVRLLQGVVDQRSFQLGDGLFQVDGFIRGALVRHNLGPHGRDLAERWKIPDIKRLAVPAQRDGPFDGVLQLSDIAGPGLLAEMGHDAGFQALAAYTFAAADLFQETVIVLYEKVREGKFDLQCLLKTFLYSVARRLWLKKLQQQQRYSAPLPDSLEDTVAVEDDIEYHIKQQNAFFIMESAMNKVGEPCKSLLEAYYLQKKHMNVIAQEFGYTNADNAKTQKYKCLVRLKKLFFAQYKNTD